MPRISSGQTQGGPALNAKDNVAEIRTGSFT